MTLMPLPYFPADQEAPLTSVAVLALLVASAAVVPLFSLKFQPAPRPAGSGGAARSRPANSKRHYGRSCKDKLIMAKGMERDS